MTMKTYITHSDPSVARVTWDTLKAGPDQFEVAKQVWALWAAKRRVLAVDTETLTVVEVTPKTIPWPELPS